MGASTISVLAIGDHATSHRADLIGDPGCTCWVMAREHHGHPLAGSLLHDRIDEGSAIAVETGVGLIEEPEFWSTQDQLRQGSSSALSGREFGHRRRA
jgi:hypothetical protein